MRAYRKLFSLELKIVGLIVVALNLLGPSVARAQYAYGSATGNLYLNNYSTLGLGLGSAAGPALVNALQCGLFNTPCLGSGGYFGGGGGYLVNYGYPSASIYGSPFANGYYSQPVPWSAGGIPLTGGTPWNAQSPWMNGSFAPTGYQMMPFIRPVTSYMLQMQPVPYYGPQVPGLPGFPQFNYNPGFMPGGAGAGLLSLLREGTGGSSSGSGSGSGINWGPYEPSSGGSRGGGKRDEPVKRDPPPAPAPKPAPAPDPVVVTEPPAPTTCVVWHPGYKEGFYSEGFHAVMFETTYPVKDASALRARILAANPKLSAAEREKVEAESVLDGVFKCTSDQLKDCGKLVVIKEIHKGRAGEQVRQQTTISPYDETSQKYCKAERERLGVAECIDCANAAAEAKRPGLQPLPTPAPAPTPKPPEAKPDTRPVGPPTGITGPTGKNESVLQGALSLMASAYGSCTAVGAEGVQKKRPFKASETYCRAPAANSAERSCPSDCKPAPQFAADAKSLLHTEGKATTVDLSSQKYNSQNFLEAALALGGLKAHPKGANASKLPDLKEFVAKPIKDDRCINATSINLKNQMADGDIYIDKAGKAIIIEGVDSDPFGFAKSGINKESDCTADKIKTQNFTFNMLQSDGSSDVGITRYSAAAYLDEKVTDAVVTKERQHFIEIAMKACQVRFSSSQKPVAINSNDFNLFRHGSASGIPLHANECKAAPMKLKEGCVPSCLPVSKK